VSAVATAASGPGCHTGDSARADRRAARPSRRDLFLLALAGVVTGFAHGALMHVWDWTFCAGSPDLGWVQGAPLDETMARLGRFHLVTSFAGDRFRAVGNALLILLDGSILAAADRLRARILFEVVDLDSRPPAPAAAGEQMQVAT